LNAHHSDPRRRAQRSSRLGAAIVLACAGLPAFVSSRASAEPPVRPAPGQADTAAVGAPAPGETQGQPSTDDPKIVEARDHFRRGAELVARAEWLEALDAFQRSAELRPHPVTTFNIGVCLRAAAQYTIARKTFLRALADDEAAGGRQLSETLRTQARGFIDQIDRLLVRVSVRLVPPDAAIAVDGRPLEPAERSTPGRATLIAGVRPPGKGEPAGAESFDVLLDPGPRVLSVSREGFNDVVVNRTFPPGARQVLNLELALLPAAIRIDADRAGGVVSVSGLDVGVVPVRIERPAGSYHVAIRKPGYVSYETHVAVKPGETANIRGTLARVEPSLFSKWWFWTAAGVVVTGAAVTTYALTRPAPQRPAPDGGSLGWVVDLRQ
jgi:hypothetical protein